MKKLVPLFSEYNSKKENFYFDKTVNEVLPSIGIDKILKTPDLLDNYINSTENQDQLNILKTLLDSDNLLKDIISKNANIAPIVSKLDSLIEKITGSNLETIKNPDIWYINKYITLKEKNFKLDNSLQKFYTEKEDYFDNKVLTTYNFNGLVNHILPSNKISIWNFFNFLISIHESDDEKNTRSNFWEKMGSSKFGAPKNTDVSNNDRSGATTTVSQNTYVIDNKLAKDFCEKIIVPAINQMPSKKWIFTKKQKTVIDYFLGNANIKLPDILSNTTSSSTQNVVSNMNKQDAQAVQKTTDAPSTNDPSSTKTPPKSNLGNTELNSASNDFKTKLTSGKA